MEETITTWVSVKDKLPSERSECIPCYSKQVLCRLNGGLLTICQYDFANKRWLNSYDHLITHWMSIPELEEEQPIEEKITAWIARDKCKELHLCLGKKPYKFEQAGQFVGEQTRFIRIDDIYPLNFPKIKWEDDEPKKVELTIKICE